MSIARWYQTAIENAVYKAWERENHTVMAVAPTGAGKTFIMGQMAKRHDSGVAIAHRQELLKQISVALAREGVMHHLHVGSKTVRSRILQEHIKETGRRWCVTANTPGVRWHVIGIDTLVKMKEREPWMDDVDLVMADEGHHVLKTNKWGIGCQIFNKARRGLLVTATPRRADGKGLGRHADGLVDVLVEVVDMRQLINEGYLTDYQIIAPDPSDLKLDEVKISLTTGDYNKDELSTHFRDNPKIVGDIVKHYLEHTPGKLGITFAVDLTEAAKIAEEYRRNGIPAEVISGDTPDALRDSLMRRFANREFLQLVSVDILGEGVDVPAVEVVSFGRPTASYSLYAQQFGRVLRLMISPELHAIWESLTVPERLAYIALSVKPKAIIIDHVGNVIRHNLPDRVQVWSLDRRDKKSRGIAEDAMPLRSCLNKLCLNPFGRHLIACPFCNTPVPEPKVNDASGPALVDGDLLLYSDELLAKMRGEVIDINKPAKIPYNLSPIIQRSVMEKHHEKLRAQISLRETINLWAGKYSDKPDRVNYKRFYLTFGIEVLAACSLGTSEAKALEAKILERICA